MNDNPPQHNLKASSVLLIIGGAATIAMALLADRLGFGQRGSFGTGQFLLLLIGLLVLLTGVVGKRVVHIYRGAAIVLLNTLLLLGLLELGAIFLGRTSQLAEHENINELPYYAAQDWTEVYWDEARSAENYRYKPYVIWQHLPFSGEAVNFSEEGVRHTPGSDCRPGAYRVFTFGGSTMLGWGSPDWGTIPAYLQLGLEELMERPVCVVNLAEDGYVSTQSLVGLVLHLQSGNVPDMVVFYDGVNEALAAYESGQSGAHVTLAKIASKFEEREHPLAKWLKASRLYALIGSLIARQGIARHSIASGSLDDPAEQTAMLRLADSVTEAYVGNHRIVGALAQEYGFDYSFFWQPHLVVGGKALTQDERAMRSTMDPGWANLAIAIYQNMEVVASEYENIWYIADVFENQDTQIWIDEAGHVTPYGNQLIAQEILRIIEKRLAEGGLSQEARQ